MKLRHAAVAVSIVAIVAFVAYARNNQDPSAKPSPAPSAAAASPGAAAAAGASPAAAAADDPKLFYALGMLLGQNVRILHLTPAELEQVKLGLADAALGKKTDIDLNSYGPKLQAFGAQRIKQVGEAEKARGQAFKDAAAKEAGRGAGSLRSRVQGDHRRHRQEPGVHRHGEGPLPRHAHRRHGVRQLHHARRSRPSSR